VLDQIEVTRSREDKAGGHVHFSMKALMQPADGLTETLAKRTYASKALVPACSWLEERAPRTPEATVSVRDGRRVLRLEPSGKGISLWGIWTLDPNGWLFEVIPSRERSIPLQTGITKVVVTAVDRVGTESRRVTIPIR
jgi:hypothetical protein